MVCVGALWPAVSLSTVSAAVVDGGTGSFLVGAVLSWLWLLLRWWSIMALDHYFTTVLNTGPDQMVGKRGPYGVLRHPGDTGLLIGPAWHARRPELTPQYRDTAH